MDAISVHTLKNKLDAGESFTLIDVREPDEYAICNLKGQLIPLADLADRLGVLNTQAEYVVHCKMGGRSAHAVQLMQSAGFTNVKNLTGGIMAWIEAIDPSLKRY